MLTSEAAFKQVWDELARTKAPEEVVFGSWLAPRYSRELDAKDFYSVERSIDACQNDVILDLGCGALARALVHFGQRRFRIVGVDVSPAAAVHARNVVKKMKIEDVVDVVVADAEQLPFKPAVFDKVLAVALVSHLPSRKSILKALREVCFCVKKGGLCYLNWWLNLYSPFSLLLSLANRAGFLGKEQRIQLLMFKGSDEVKKLCSQAGLSVASIVRGSVSWYLGYLVPRVMRSWSEKLLKVVGSSRSWSSKGLLPSFFFDLVAQKG